MWSGTRGSGREKSRLRRSPVLAFCLLIVTSGVQASGLTAIHDFRDLVAGQPHPALVHEFEGLAFTADGTLWASIAPNPTGTTKEFWQLDLQNRQVLQRIPDTIADPQAETANPVALAGSGQRLIVGERLPAVFGVQSSLIWAFTPGISTPASPDWSFLRIGCGVEGAASAGSRLYLTCGTSIVEPSLSGSPIDSFNLAGQLSNPGGRLLGLEAIDGNQLLVGGYRTGSGERNELLIVDLGLKTISRTIDLDSLFVGPNSDYFRLAGSEYSVQVAPGESYRPRPDPDALAYRDGRIYLAFDGDLRIFEISLNAPEPPSVLLLGVALLALRARPLPARKEAGPLA